MSFRAFYRRQLMFAKKRANDDFINRSHNKVAAAWKVIKGVKLHDKVPLSSDELNFYFTNIADSIVESLPTSTTCPLSYLDSLVVDSGFSFQRVSYNDVRDIVSRLKNSESRDAYGMCVKIFGLLLTLFLYP